MIGEKPVWRSMFGDSFRSRIFRCGGLWLPHFLIFKEKLKWTRWIKKGKSRSRKTWEILQSYFPEWNAKLPATTESTSLSHLIIINVVNAEQSFPKERRHPIAKNVRSRDRDVYTKRITLCSALLHRVIFIFCRLKEPSYLRRGRCRKSRRAPWVSRVPRT